MKITKSLTIKLLSTMTVIVTGIASFLLWQSRPESHAPVTTHEPSKQKRVEAVTPEPSPSNVAFDETLGSGFAVTYPKEWTKTRSGAAAPQSTDKVQVDENTITSPSGKIQVVLKVQTNFQTAHHCTSDYIKLKHLKTDATPQFASGRFAAYVVYFPNINLYQYHVGLQNNTDAIRGVSLTSNTACNFMFNEFVQRPSSLPNVPTTHTLLAIRFVDLYNGENLKPGVDELKIAEKLSGSEYEQAKAIVESVHIAQDR